MMRHQKGFTLVEIAIVLTIIGLIIGGIWSAATIIMQNQKNNELATDIIQTVINTETLFNSVVMRHPHFAPTTALARQHSRGRPGFILATFVCTNGCDWLPAPTGSGGTIGGSSGSGSSGTGTSGTSGSGSTGSSGTTSGSSGSTGTGPADGFNNTAAIGGGLVPQNMITNAGYIVQPFATETAQDSVVFSGSGNTISMAIGVDDNMSSSTGSGMSSAACTNFAATIGTASNINTYHITNIVMDGTADTMTDGITPDPVTVPVAANNCNQPGNNNYVQVSFYIP